MQTAEIEALLILFWGQWGYQRLIINVINHQPGVVLRRRHVIQTLVHVGQLSDQCRIVRKPFMRRFEHFPRLCDITAIPQGVTKRCWVLLLFGSSSSAARKSLTAAGTL